MDAEPRASSPAAAPALRPWLVAGLQRAARLVVLGILLAIFYAWGAPRFYPEKGEAGFWYGTLHGALMPMALPALLAAREVPIYAERNTGRFYKLGYIAGINACGFIVFGLLFLKPREPQHHQDPKISSTSPRPPAH